MPVFACPNCLRPLQIPELAAGNALRCPLCQAVFQVPESAAAGSAKTGSAPTPVNAAPPRDFEQAVQPPPAFQQAPVPENFPKRADEVQGSARPRADAEPKEVDIALGLHAHLGGPALSLNLALAVNFLIVLVFVINSSLAAFAGAPYALLGLGLLLLFFLPPQVFLSIAAVQFKKLERRGLIVTGALMALGTALLLVVVMVLMLVVTLQLIRLGVVPTAGTYLNALLFLAGIFINVLAGAWVLVVLGRRNTGAASEGSSQAEEPTAFTGTYRWPLWIASGAVCCVVLVVSLAFSMTPWASQRELNQMQRAKPKPPPRDWAPVQPPVPPAKFPEPDPPRPAYGDAVARKVELTNGRFEGQFKNDKTDPLDQRDKVRPVKLFLVPFKAHHLYKMEIKANVRGGTFRLEDLAGTTLAQGKEDAGPGQPSSVFLFKAPRSETGRVVVFAGDSVFQLTIRELQRVPPEKISVAKKIDAYTAAAIAPDGKSAWVALADGRLQEFSCPDFEIKQELKLPAPCFHLLLNEKGVLFASLRSKQRQAREDLYLYNTHKLEQRNGVLVPAKTLTLTWEAPLLLSPDHRWLYDLDRVAGKVSRVNVEQAKVEKAVTIPRASSIGLSPNGKDLYVLGQLGSNGSNLNHLDGDTLDPVINLPLALSLDDYRLQATDDGYVFFHQNRGNVFLVDRKSEFPFLDQMKVFPWTSSFSDAILAIRLSADQQRLYCVTHRSIRSLHLVRGPELIEGQESGRLEIKQGSLTGRLEVSRDGTFAFCEHGVILRLEKEQ